MTGIPSEQASAPYPLVRGEHTLGPATRLLVLSDGLCRFDGGAMFGVVPKPLWSRVVAADEANRVAIGLNTLVVQTRQRDALRTVVIETGFGPKLPAKLASIYGAQARLLDAFASAGIAPGSVDAVINTHLHWDHCGWNTRLAADGEGIEPTFPNALYFAHSGEIAHGRARHERDAVSYVPENYEPLLASGQMEALDIRAGEEREILPGIAVELFPGHTRQLMAVHIRDQASGARACYISDLVPTVAHLPLTWGMGFDLDPMRNIEEKKRFYGRAIAENWLVCFTHEPQHPLGYLEAAANGARLRTPVDK
jgi:glyoxylase-like metal-dependent hydrolase (beta-lactamase superfamily II)